MILIIIYNYNFKLSLLSVLLKVTLVGLFNPSGIPMSFGGSFCSFFVMFLLFKSLNSNKFMIFVSGAGGFFHSLGQIIFGFIYYGLIDIKQTVLTGKVDINVLIYSPVMLVMGIITGIIMGFTARYINIYLNKQHIIINKYIGDE